MAKIIHGPNGETLRHFNESNRILRNNGCSYQLSEEEEEEMRRIRYGHTVDGEYIPGHIYFYTMYFYLEKDVKASLWKYILETMDALCEMKPANADQIASNPNLHQIGGTPYVTANEKTLLLMARQVGKTTTLVASLMWHFLTVPGFRCLGLGRDATQSKDILNRFYASWEQLPAWMQKPVVTSITSKISFDDGAFFEVFKHKTIRGLSGDCIILDEYAFYANAEEIFFTNTPIIQSSKIGPKVVVSSTPNGKNDFFKKYNNTAENGFKVLEYAWGDCPRYADDPGFFDRTLADCGSINAFRQEYENSFLGGSMSLINIDTMQHLEDNASEPLYIESGKDNSLDLHVFKSPHKCSEKLLITCDVSGGLGGDSSTFTVFDLGCLPYETVATFSSKTTHPEMLPRLIAETYNLYGDMPLLTIESNYSPTLPSMLRDFLPGQEDRVLYGLRKSDAKKLEMETSRILFGDESELIERNNIRPGIYTEASMKQESVATMKKIIELGMLKITDKRIIDELTTFVRKNEHTEQYSADNGAHDDFVANLWMMCHVILQDGIKNWLGHDPLEIMKRRVQGVDMEKIARDSGILIKNELAVWWKKDLTINGRDISQNNFKHKKY